MCVAAKRKHNNNVGAVSQYQSMTEEVKQDLDIAQAFSHFTYAHSNGQILICDIQGTRFCAEHAIFSLGR